MELKELKCKNCGAKIEINEKDTLATCKYCNTSFSINECDNHNSELKKTSISEKQEKQMKTILKFMFFNPFTISISNNSHIPIKQMNTSVISFSKFEL